MRHQPLTSRSDRSRPGGGEARRWAPVALLLLSLAVAGFGAFQAHQAQRSHRATADALLSDYGTFAAWSYAERWAQAVHSSFLTTLETIHQAARTGQVSEECLDNVLLVGTPEEESCGCGERLAGPGSWAFHLTYSGHAARLFTRGPAPEEAERDRVLSEVLAHARGRLERDDRSSLVYVPAGEGAPGRVVAYTRVAVADAQGRTMTGDTAIYGLEVDPAVLRRMSEAALDVPGLLPPTLTDGVPSREILAVTIRSPDGSAFFESEPGVSLTHVAEQEIAAAYGGGVVQASVLPEAADGLIIGGLPRNRLPLLLLVLGLSAALALMALRQLRREDQLARLRSDFVASVSHELRTPLAQVRLFVETLRLGRVRTPEQREWALRSLDRETLRLAGLVENVLAFSRAERGRLGALELRPTDVGDEVRAVVRAFEPLVPPGQAEIVVDTEGRTEAMLHRDAFRQVLLNLLENAVKYGPRGQRVRVSARGHGDALRLAVEDQGPGVPKPEREAIWAPFRRGSETLGTVVAGSGIGLAVVRDIVAAHRGRAWVEEAEGGGARFVVELSLLRTEAAPRPVRDPAAGRLASAEVA